LRRIKITVPATLTNIGPGIQSLSLAIGLHAQVEFSERRDTTVQVEHTGLGADRYSQGLDHPALLAAIRVFQQQEQAPIGFNVRIKSVIPPYSGLGAETALTVAGVIGAVNLLSINLSREHILNIAGEVLGRVDGAVAAILGGLTVGTIHEGDVYYRTLSMAETKLVVVYPRIKRYSRRVAKAIGKTVTYDDAIDHLARLPLLIDALERGELEIVDKLIDDHFNIPHLIKNHPHFDEAVDVAQRAGALGVTLTGRGPALIAFTRDHHQEISEAICRVFRQNEIEVKAWVVPIDRQGVAVSMTQSA
jgi:homoserine kinase